MNGCRYKTPSFPRAGALAPAVLGVVFLVIVFLPLLAFGAPKAKKPARNWTKELSDRDAHKRRKAAAEAGRLRDKGAAAALRATLRDGDASVRREAAAAAGMAGDAGAVPALVGALDDADPSVRYAAIRSLGLLRSPQAVAALTDAVGWGDAGERALALEALAKVGSTEALAPVLQSAGAEDPGEAAEALRALQWAGTEESLEALRRGAARPETTPRAAAVFAMARRGILAEAWGTAEALLIDADPAVRVEAAQAAGLSARGLPAARAGLERAAGAEREGWVKAAMEAALR